MNYAIWAAVSTQAQATPEKASLAEQEQKCRATASAKGWKETAPPYIVEGKSRTRWVNLRDAEAEIPELHQMLVDAKAGVFDILVLYDYNRLRDLADPIAKTLASYGAQMYSISQPVQPLAPEEFNPYASDSEFMMRGMSNIIQKWQIADLRRKYRYGISKRISNGLHGLRIPYGYKKPHGRTDPQAVPLLDPLVARVLVEMKDGYLAGMTVSEITRRANAHNVKNPPFIDSTVMRILTNPFYAGMVYQGKYKNVRDPHTNSFRVQINEEFRIEKGQHQGAWDYETYLLLVEEKKRRSDKSRPRRFYKPFTGLLRCTICNERPWHRRNYIRCQYRQGENKDHLALKVDKAYQIIPEAIVKALREIDPASPPDTTPQTDARSLEALQKRRAKVQDGYEADLYTAEEARQRIEEIDAEITAIQTDQHDAIKKDAMRQKFSTAVEEIQKTLNDLPAWINSADPKEVNRVLRLLIEDILITPEHEIKIIFRE